MYVGAALVTEAGTGLGGALCAELCAREHRVAGLARRSEDLEETARLAGQLFTGIVYDPADPTAVSRAFRKVRSQIGPVDILINNPVVPPRRDFLDETAESFMAILSVNVIGAMACTREALWDMVERGEGRILNVISSADLDPPPTSSTYTVSEAARRTLTPVLVADLADRFPKIVISDWDPGLVAAGTGLSDGSTLEVAARWGTSLAMMRDPALTGSLWKQDREILPRSSLRQRIAYRLLGRTQVSRRGSRESLGYIPA
jgi:NAD(P)-dependent dehydrogenase (short-subunit alcohol dehydrogenase family)